MKTQTKTFEGFGDWLDIEWSEEGEDKMTSYLWSTSSLLKMWTEICSSCITGNSQEKHSISLHSRPTGSETTFPKDSQGVWMNAEVREELV